MLRERAGEGDGIHSQLTETVGEGDGRGRGGESLSRGGVTINEDAEGREG